MMYQNNDNEGQNHEWMSISDMMSGLMLIFLFIAILYILEMQMKKQEITEIVVTYDKLKRELNSDLKTAFESDLVRWNAEILEDNTVRFKNPEILFESGKSKLKDNFKTILNEFFPRYTTILSSQKYIEDIEEIKIEGHTSTDWENAKDENIKYLKNAKLSQERAFAVLDYVVNIDKEHFSWLIKILRANGLAFAKPVYIENVEDKNLSRRVDFKVVTKTEEKILKILEIEKNR